MTTAPLRLCFVCLGNICRSPTAEGVMKQLALDAGLSERLWIDSAGTGAYHEGEPADSRSRAEAKRRGVELTSISRQFKASDFDAFDYVLAMDRRNFRDLQQLARGPAQLGKLHLFRSFDAGAGDQLDVPDPYNEPSYDPRTLLGYDGFARVYEICQAGCDGLLAHLRRTHGL
jgi:protein-tyrosine phosphatase